MTNIGSVAVTRYPRVAPNRFWGLIRLEADPQAQLRFEKFS